MTTPFVCPMCSVEGKPCPGGAHVNALWEAGIRTPEDYKKFMSAPRSVGVNRTQ